MLQDDNMDGEGRGGSHLATKSSRSLLSAALPGAVWSVDVVEASYSALDTKVLVVVHRQLLTGQLFQTICVLGLNQIQDSFSIGACVDCLITATVPPQLQAHAQFCKLRQWISLVKPLCSSAFPKTQNSPHRIIPSTAGQVSSSSSLEGP
jgi:hypothetical protein